MLTGLEKLLRCAWCGVWFHGRRDARFCPGNCRPVAHRVSERAKACYGSRNGSAMVDVLSVEPASVVHLYQRDTMTVRVTPAVRAQLDAGQVVVVALAPGKSPKEVHAAMSQVAPAGVAHVRRQTGVDIAKASVGKRPAAYLIEGLGEPLARQLALGQVTGVDVVLVEVETHKRKVS